MSEVVITDGEGNTPLDLRPDLSVFGIEEHDRGQCEDTYENRRVLRGAKLQWSTIWDDKGQPSGLIMAISNEMSAHKSASSLEDKKALLEDPRNKNSDYVTGLDLILVDDLSTLVPPWVIGATNAFRKIEDDPEMVAKRNLVGPPARCTAIKSDGVRCQMWTGGRKNDQLMCRIHLGSLRNTPGNAVLQARTRIFQSAPAAVSVLEDLMLNAISEPVRAKAAESLLDRAGIRGGVEIESTVTLDVRPAASLIAERLAKLALSGPKPQPEPEPDIVDAEIVD